MTLGLLKSLILHFGILVVFFYGAEIFKKNKRFEIIEIPLDIVDISDKTVSKIQKQKKKSKTTPKKSDFFTPPTPQSKPTPPEYVTKEKKKKSQKKMTKKKEKKKNLKKKKKKEWRVYLNQ